MVEINALMSRFILNNQHMLFCFRSSVEKNLFLTFTWQFHSLSIKFIESISILFFVLNLTFPYNSLYKFEASVRALVRLDSLNPSKISKLV